MFTQPCFIRSNSKTIIDNLLELGYQKVFEDRFYNSNKYISIKNGEIIPTDKDYLENLVNEGFVDCGTHRVMFYALAALNDKHDNKQWFINDTTKTWEKCDVPSEYMLLNGHKASALEIIRHFNT